MGLYPSISIIIPSYNQGPYIERTLLSILKQSYSGDVEIIVSDGGSKDQTIETLNKYSNLITWWSAPDNGYVDAVMKGIKIAKGSIIAIQSSDDYYLKDAFKKMASAFIKYPDASFISGGFPQIDIKNNIVASWKPDWEITPEKILFAGFPPQHATFVKKEYWNAIKEMRTEVDMCADVDLLYRISHIKAGQFVDEYLAVYQLHDEQRTQTSNEWYNSLVKMVELCEEDDFYKSKFSLSDSQKINLLARWEIQWTSILDKNKALKIYQDKFKQNNNLDIDTINYINQILNIDQSSQNFMKKVANKIKYELRKLIFSDKPLKLPYSIHWWKDDV